MKNPMLTSLLEGSQVTVIAETNPSNQHSLTSINKRREIPICDQDGRPKLS